MIRNIIVIMFISGCISSFSQDTRDLVNDGVEQYNNKEYTDSEVNFMKGLEKSPENFEAKFNLGDAYYKQEKYEEALKSFNSALEQAESKDLKAKVYHNMGNSLLKSQKLEESIEAYKSALKNNPDDEDTKYNLSYALSMLNQQQQQQKQDQKNDDKDKKDQQDQNKQEGDDKKDDQQKDQQDQQSKPEEDQSSKQDNLKQPKKNEISKEEAMRILDALKNNEKDLQKKLRKQTGTPVTTEKDW